MSVKLFLCFFAIVGTIYLVAWGSAFADVVRDGDKTYIVDRTGERWDVTQARSIGFVPERFDYGLGKQAFTPLDDSYLTDDTAWVYDGLRVIGVTDGTQAKAYSISKLSRHEIANSMIGSEPIAVGY
jgi:hypothetical protein